jgi:hypothetical protein
LTFLSAVSQVFNLRTARILQRVDIFQRFLLPGAHNFVTGPGRTPHEFVFPLAIGLLFANYRGYRSHRFDWRILASFRGARSEKDS